jgi:hypothetical protein
VPGTIASIQPIIRKFADEIRSPEDFTVQPDCNFQPACSGTEAACAYNAERKRKDANRIMESSGHSNFSDSTGSSCAARVAGSVPKTTPTRVAAASAMIADNPEIGIRYAVKSRTE